MQVRAEGLRIEHTVAMQDGDSSDAYLREMAIRCRMLADQVLSVHAADSLRKLAMEYEKAIEARLELRAFGGDLVVLST